MIFWRFLAAKEQNATKWVEIDKDYLRTRTAIGSRAYHEQWLRFLVLVVTTVACSVDQIYDLSSLITGSCFIFSTTFSFVFFCFIIIMLHFCLILRSKSLRYCIHIFLIRPAMFRSEECSVIISVWDNWQGLWASNRPTTYLCRI